MDNHPMRDQFGNDLSFSEIVRQALDAYVGANGVQFHHEVQWGGSHARHYTPLRGFTTSNRTVFAETGRVGYLMPVYGNQSILQAGGWATHSSIA